MNKNDDIRIILKFAWLPTITTDCGLIWLASYFSEQKYKEVNITDLDTGRILPCYIWLTLKKFKKLI